MGDDSSGLMIFMICSTLFTLLLVLGKRCPPYQTIPLFVLCLLFPSSPFCSLPNYTYVLLLFLPRAVCVEAIISV